MQLRIQGGQGGHAPPPVPVKTSHKKMATIRGALYFMFLAPPPPPSDHPGADAEMNSFLRNACMYLTTAGKINHLETKPVEQPDQFPTQNIKPWFNTRRK